MNPHASHSASLGLAITSTWRHRQLVAQMVRREIVGRYQGSVMGVAWSFLHPVLLLVIYTFVFSKIFQARWDVGAGESSGDYALVLFVGLIIHGMFAEVAIRSPQLILTNANFVKKVVFPLETLPVVAIIAALFHALVSVAVFLLTFLLFKGYVEWTAVLLPLIMVPLAVLVLGLSWLLSSLGVFIRDVGQTIGLVVTAMLFLAPVVYPITVVPAELRSWLWLNPLTFPIEQAREVLVWGRIPDWTGLALYSLAALLVAGTGFAWFQKTRRGFADVL